MFKTRFTEIFGIEHPVIQGGMQRVSTAELVAAVANAGALGFLSALTQPTPADLAAEIKKTQTLTDKPFGVNITSNFEPLYVVPSDKKATVRELKALLKDAEVLYLATDEDREGESISWHLMELLNPKVPVRRMVFHEITKEAIRDALEHTRDIDQDLVRAQETRRILDRQQRRFERHVRRLSGGHVRTPRPARGSGGRRPERGGRQYHFGFARARGPGRHGDRFGGPGGGIDASGPGPGGGGLRETEDQLR